MQENQEATTIPEMVENMRAGKMPRRNFIKALTAMGVTATGAVVIATVAESKAFTTKPDVVRNADEETTRNLNLHDKHLAKQNQGDAGGMKNDYAHDAVVEDSMSETAFVGHAAILARKGTGFEAIPNLKIAVTNRIAHGSQVTVEWVATGTHSGHLPGLPASGRAFSIPGVTVVVRQNGKITRESIYYDIAEVHRQLGK